MNPIRKLSEFLFALCLKPNRILAIVIGLLFSSCFGLALWTIRVINYPETANGLQPTIVRMLIANGLGLAASVLLAFLLGKATRSKGGFDRFIQVYGVRS